MHIGRINFSGNYRAAGTLHDLRQLFGRFLSVFCLLNLRNFEIKNMKHTGDNIIAFFRNAANKLEELQVQASLGKAELSDKLEEIKKEAKHRIVELKTEAYTVADKSKAKYDELKAKIEHLEVQIALGKAETLDELHQQKKKLKETIHDVRRLLND